MILKLGMEYLGLIVYKMYFNDDPGLTIHHIFGKDKFQKCLKSQFKGWGALA